jgi:hypothetical protein
MQKIWVQNYIILVKVYGLRFKGYGLWFMGVRRGDKVCYE